VEQDVRERPPEGKAPVRPVRPSLSGMTQRPPPMHARDVPPAACLVRARQLLGEPGPEAESMLVRLDAGTEWGRFNVTFVPRQYSNGTWRWEIWSSKRVDLLPGTPPRA
jgi:hypothetical protein